MIGLRLVVIGTVWATVLTAPFDVLAQDRSFNPGIFHPAPGPDKFVAVESAVPFAHKAWGVGLMFSYARNELTLAGFDTIMQQPTGVRADVIAHSISADL